MIGQHIRASRDGFNHGDIEIFCERGQLRHGPRILNAAACDNHRTLGRHDNGARRCDLVFAGTLAANLMDAFGKERFGIIKGPTLHVLRQTDEGWPAIGGVQHCRQSVRQRLNNLRRMGDAIPITADRFERIIHAQCRISEVFKLLQHRIWQAG